MSNVITAAEANKIYLNGIVDELDDVFDRIRESAKDSTSVTLDDSDWKYQSARWFELVEALEQFGFSVTYHDHLYKTVVSWNGK